MEKTINEILKNAATIPGVSLKKGSNSNELYLDISTGSGKQIYYTLFPGITLAFMKINSPIWPESKSNTNIRPLRINYCISGRTEILLDDNTYAYLREKDFAISLQTAQKEFRFPTGHYQGIAIFLDDISPEDPAWLLLDAFGLNFTRLKELYCQEQKTYIAETTDEIDLLFHKLWKYSETPSFFYMKLYILELLHLLSQKINALSPKYTFYTGIQVEIAKKTKAILTADLSKHYPIRKLADQFAISDTSIKNYFRGVYGQNISTYLRELRMKTAAEMLSETQKPISEISYHVGYTNQGKFAAVFKEHFHVTPLEYRRSRRLERI